MSARVRSGLDRLAQGDEAAAQLVRGRRVGLLAHAASVDARLRPAEQLVREAGAQLVALFVRSTQAFGGTPFCMATRKRE